MTDLIWITPDVEKLMIYIARVSSQHQDNPDYTGLLRYCIKHKHWSPFEHGYACMEINTTRAIAAQIIRHRSFTFQEFSQRYATPAGFTLSAPRRQGTTNRQSSIDDLSDQETWDWLVEADALARQAFELYQTALKDGVARECARDILPMCTNTRLYMTGSIRSWIHYLLLRLQPDTQKEHRDVALDILSKLKPHIPHTWEALCLTNDC